MLLTSFSPEIIMHRLCSRLKSKPKQHIIGKVNIESENWSIVGRAYLEHVCVYSKKQKSRYLEINETWNEIPDKDQIQSRPEKNSISITRETFNILRCPPSGPTSTPFKKLDSGEILKFQKKTKTGSRKKTSTNCLQFFTWHFEKKREVGVGREREWKASTTHKSPSAYKYTCSLRRS